MVNTQDICIDKDVSIFFETHKIKEIQDAHNLDIQDLHHCYMCFQQKDGQLIYGWELESIWLYVWFHGNGMYTYYAVLADDQKFFGDDIDVSQELPLEILKAIAD